MTTRKSLLLPRRLAAVAAASALSLAGAARADQFHYVVLGDGGVPVARHVLERKEDPCLQIRLYGVTGHGPISHDMTVRFAGSENFPIKVCEYVIPKKATKAEMFHGTSEPIHLPLPKPEAHHIAVLGDTGCRVKAEEKHAQPAAATEDEGTSDDEDVTIQNCTNHDQSDPNSKDVWPLQQIAEAAAAKNPDLVVHVGDFIYRKAPCPKDNPKCTTGGLSYGTAWDTLKNEILLPARTLLAKAPWVMPRGNHENCDVRKTIEAQGGMGYFILFDPRPFSEVVHSEKMKAYFDFLKPRKGKGDKDHSKGVQAACDETTPPYLVPVSSDLELWVLDSNEPEDELSKVKEPLVAKFKGFFEHLSKETRTKHAFIVTHRPLYGLYPGARKHLPKDDEKLKTVRPREMNVTLQEAFEQANKPGEVDLVIAGHMHVFQVVSFLDKQRPPNISVGNSGTQLDEHFMKFPGLVNIGAQDFELGKAQAKKKVKGFTLSDFGFLWLDRDPHHGWNNARLYDRRGHAVLVDCALAKGEASCTKAH